MQVNMGEFNEGVWGSAVTIALAPLAEPILRKAFLKKYGSNAPDDIVSFWSIIFGSALYGTITQAKTNGLEGVYANFLSMLPYGVSFVVVNEATKRFLPDVYEKRVFNPNDAKKKVKGQLTPSEARKMQRSFRETMKAVRSRSKEDRKYTIRELLIDRSTKRMLVRSAITALLGFGLNRVLEKQYLKPKESVSGGLQSSGSVGSSTGASSASYQGMRPIHSIPHMGRPQAVRVGTIPNPYVHRR